MHIDEMGMVYEKIYSDFLFTSAQTVMQYILLMIVATIIGVSLIWFIRKDKNRY